MIQKTNRKRKARMENNTTTIEKRPFWSKKMTGILKSVAIILMFIHHFFSIQRYLPSDHPYAWAADFEKYFTAPTKSCVAIFAFITGYMYFFSKKKSFESSLKSCGNLLIRYWVIAFPLLALAVVSGVYQASFSNIILELFGLQGNVMCFAWYVYFYLFIMLFLPLMVKLFRNKTWLLLLLLFLAFNFLFSPIYALISNDLLSFKTIVSNCWITLFPTVMGYAIAGSDLYSRVKKQLDKVPSFLRALLLIVLLGASFMAPYLFYFDFVELFHVGRFTFGLAINGYAFYIPVFIFCLVELLSFLENKKAIRVFEILGKYSVYMWFWHCMFFGALSRYTKRVLYAPRNPILVLIWGILICLSFSVVSDLVAQAILSLFKKNAHPKDAHQDKAGSKEET